MNPKKELNLHVEDFYGTSLGTHTEQQSHTFCGVKLQHKKFSRIESPFSLVSVLALLVSITVIASLLVVLGGLVVIVLAIRRKLRWFKHGRGRWLFMGDKNP
jgi:hypothetical protein